LATPYPPPKRRDYTLSQKKKVREEENHTHKEEEIKENISSGLYLEKSLKREGKVEVVGKHEETCVRLSLEEMKKNNQLSRGSLGSLESDWRRDNNLRTMIKNPVGRKKIPRKFGDNEPDSEGEDRANEMGDRLGRERFTGKVGEREGEKKRNNLTADRERKGTGIDRGERGKNG